MSFLLSSPGATNLSDVLEKYPERGSLILRLIDDIMRTDSPLTHGERELIFVYISGLNACQYCFYSHTPAATAFGIDESIFGDMDVDLDTPKIDEKLKPILSYVKKLTLTPAKITQADVDAIYAEGWNEQAFVDAVSLCSAVNFMNRFVKGVGVDVDAETAYQTGGSVLPTIGYSGWAESLENQYFKNYKTTGLTNHHFNSRKYLLNNRRQVLKKPV